MAALRPRTVTLTIRAPLERADLPGLFARTCMLLGDGDGDGGGDGDDSGGGGDELGGPVLLCEVAGVPADAVAVDALARLALAARRSRCRVLLRGASTELIGLVAFMGLGEVLRE